MASRVDYAETDEIAEYKQNVEMLRRVKECISRHRSDLDFELESRERHASPTTFRLLLGAEPQTCFFGLIARARPCIGQLALKGEPKKRRPSWLLLVYGQEHAGQLTVLAGHLQKEFNVRVAVRLGMLEPGQEGFYWGDIPKPIMRDR